MFSHITVDSVLSENFITADSDLSAVERNVKVSVRRMNFSRSQCASMPSASDVEGLTRRRASSNYSIMNVLTASRVNPLGGSIAQDFVVVLGDFM